MSWIGRDDTPATTPCALSRGHAWVMENFGKWVLVLAGLGFLGFGVAITAAPAAVLAGVGITGSPAGLVELRAFYGGLELGLGTFLLICAARPAWRGSPASTAPPTTWPPAPTRCR